MISKHQLRAIKIAKELLREIPFWIKAKVKEKEVADKIREFLKKNRVEAAFRIIVASGKRSAKPHGFATNKVIKKGELVVVDFGVKCLGYCSDVTRTYVVGKATTKQKRILTVVEKAQKKAILTVKAGVECRKVDQAARDFIIKKGFGKYFIHNTGHGIGKKVHEPPKISRKNWNLLREGEIITIEPGIYIKGWGGARIEDMVLVTKGGAVVLTR
ncbi:MAG: M24 family metallopeptidase [Candidatus Margulisiibacteriota bacterium]